MQISRSIDAAVESVELLDRFPILPCQNRVLLPGAIVQIRCATPSSVKLVEQELLKRKEKTVIGILPVLDPAAAEAPSAGTIPSSGTGTNLGGRSSKHQDEISDSHKHGCEKKQEVIRWHNRGVAARPLRLSRYVEETSGGFTYLVVFEGLCRFSVQAFIRSGMYCTARITSLGMTKAEMDHVERDPDVIALSRQFKATAMELISVLEQTGGSSQVLQETVPMHKLADIFVARCEFSFEDQLAMLDSVDVKVRLSKAIQLVRRHLQMRVIKEGLGDNDDEEDDVTALERKMQDARMPADIWKHALRELRRLKKMQPQQQEYNSSRGYLELLADLPWQKTSEERELDVTAAKEHLDNDHYGLEKAKQRIIEYVAVHKLKADARGLVLCFVGPPGVGKTSLGPSIAAALGRKFFSISLGGVKDEAGIRGQRLTGIGSRPGCLIDGLKKVGVRNPVILLDEIDKMGFDVWGGPASALLEVFDPEQNKTFNDHYLNVPFDLSDVIFLATANSADPIPRPLFDRMEIIELPGYTPEEKLRIAMQHLIPRILEKHCLSFDFFQVPEAMVKLVIQRYTREAGVRNLQRKLAALARAAAVRVAEQDHATHGRLTGEGKVAMEVTPVEVNNHDMSNAFRVSSPFIVDQAMLEKVLGPPRYDDREAADRVATTGVSTGLVWTFNGGEVLYVEATAMVGRGDLYLTGQLGNVMKESALIALTWVRARAKELKLVTSEESNLLQDRDIHIHLPAGAMPKEGPSAGVTIVTALVSLFSRRTVRADTAMTGEMTLSGLVLGVGGINEKILAAHRHGIKRVILPESNFYDIYQVPVDVRSSLEIFYVKKMEDILEHAFEGGWHGRHH